MRLITLGVVFLAGCGLPPAPPNVGPTNMVLVRGSVSAIPDDFEQDPVTLQHAVFRDAPLSSAQDDGVVPIPRETQSVTLPLTGHVAGTSTPIDVDIVLQFSKGQNPAALHLPTADEGPFDILLVGGVTELPPATVLSGFNVTAPDGPRFSIGSGSGQLNFESFNPDVFDWRIAFGAQTSAGIDNPGYTWSTHQLDVTRDGKRTGVDPGETKTIPGTPPLQFENIMANQFSTCSGCLQESGAWLITRER
jgi:hypothetical protein